MEVADELSDSLEFSIKTETEELTEPLLTNNEVSLKIALGEFVLRDYNKKGKVWSVFAKIYTQNFELVPGFVCCKDCGRLLAFRKNNSTSNLVKHKCYVVRYVHRGEPHKPEYLSRSFEHIEIQNTGNSNSSFEYKLGDTIDSANSNLTNLFTKCFIQNCLSYEILQNEDFKAICQKLLLVGAKCGENVDVENVIPNRMAVAKNINEIYEKCVGKVCKEIAAIKENGFGLACHVGKSFLVLTIHFLNTGKITNRLLGLRTMESDGYSSQNISEKVCDILKEYNCELSSTSLIVVSGSSNITEAQTVPCISTLLGNALTKSMDEVPEVSQLIANCMQLHRFLIMNQIEIIQEKLASCNNFASPRNFLSLFKVLEFMANSWEEIEDNVKLESEATMENINELHLEAVIKTLRPFKDAIESWEDDGHATSYLVIVYLHELKKSCEVNDSEAKQYNFIKKIKKLLRQNLDKFVAENVTIFHKVALFLYPPANKLLQFDDTEKKNIEAECKRLMESFKVDFKTNTTYTPQSKRKKLFSDFVNTDTNKDLNEIIEEELQVYKLTRVIDSEDFDPFIWWEQQQQNFLHLYKLSQMVLSTPATSSAAQRIFAFVGDLYSNDKDKEHMAFIKFNDEPDELLDSKD